VRSFILASSGGQGSELSRLGDPSDQELLKKGPPWMAGQVAC